MTDTRRFQVIAPEQAVLELVELLTHTENRYRDALAIVNAALREHGWRQTFDLSGAKGDFENLGEAREVLEALLESWKP